MNHVDLTGRPTRDPKIIAADTDEDRSTMAFFTLAVPRKGRKSEENNADFLRIKAFGTLAENIGKYVRKGKLVGVSGRLQTDSYLDKETGKLAFTTAVVAESVDFLWSRDDWPSDTYLPSDVDDIHIPPEEEEQLPFR